MSLSRTPVRPGPAKAAFWDLLTFDRLLTAPVLHLIYWAGLGVIVLIGFFIAGAAVGLALREGTLLGILLSFGLLVAGALIFVVMVLIWRAVCEFYVAVFRISEDLRALRAASTGEPQDSLRRPSGRSGLTAGD